MDYPCVQMRPSRVLQKLRSGGVVNCLRLNLDSSRAVEIGSMLGFDCIWLDSEHTSADWSLMEKQILAAKAYDTDVLVRVSRGAYSDYVKPLELDASGIMVPHVLGLADAKDVVRMTRFHPIGRRPVDSGNADGAFCNIDFHDYLRQANNNRFVIVQIEDPEPLDELEEIAALDGIDMLFFGPTDFGHGIGAPGEYSHPRIIDARNRVAEVCVARGKIAGTVTGPYEIEELLSLGYRFLNIGLDIYGLSDYCRKSLSYFQEVADTMKVASPVGP